MSATFIRRQEDFICEHCGKKVKGNGYTNHCPYCLYSKHVDINPGDRASACGGLMEPIRAELRKNEVILTHRCLKCGCLKVNKTAPEDNFDEILRIMQNSQNTK
ncbi:MAG TPA: RNHCP domain-containing protein [Flexilinea sp.]|jgi:rubrerythrin|nr:RNHCP domain-containing protein [Flexilinea sp.]HOP01724.1 RNHCP domain-containing protein [Flexilinea sp.]HPJ64392.1 RNHCP domain-containing protein [Flexilinea sp.]HPR71395.1 RNHCP domain-containing protein [Flexilinea sp.]